jgi:hypothetical protein
MTFGNNKAQNKNQQSSVSDFGTLSYPLGELKDLQSATSGICFDVMLPKQSAFGLLPQGSIDSLREVLPLRLRHFGLTPLYISSQS